MTRAERYEDALREIRAHATGRVMADGKVSAAWLIEIVCEALQAPDPSPKEDAPRCPDCGGRGAVGWHPDSRLTCLSCGGTGRSPSSGGGR